MCAWNNGMSNQGDESHCCADPSQHKSTMIMDILYNAWRPLHRTLTPFFNLFPQIAATGTATY